VRSEDDVATEEAQEMGVMRPVYLSLGFGRDRYLSATLRAGE
jgi:hypothetical protein